MQFIKFTEINDNEGEQWNFFLQTEGNEEELEKLRKGIDGFEERYTLGKEIFNEAEVDIIVDNTDSGYIDFNNKVVGEFNSKDMELTDYDDRLYKGGIMSMFKTV